MCLIWCLLLYRRQRCCLHCCSTEADCLYIVCWVVYINGCHLQNDHTYLIQLVPKTQIVITAAQSHKNISKITIWQNAISHAIFGERSDLSQHSIKNEGLWCYTDVLANKSNSPDVREHAYFNADPCKHHCYFQFYIENAKKIQL